MKREPDDSDEVLEAVAEYEKEAANLLERIEKRDEMAALLKVAKPSKIAGIREVVSRMNRGIEQTEILLELRAQAVEQRRDLDGQYRQLDETLNLIKPEFLKHIAEQHPEKLAEMTALFENDAEDRADQSH